MFCTLRTYGPREIHELYICISTTVFIQCSTCRTAHETSTIFTLQLPVPSKNYNARGEAHPTAVKARLMHALLLRQLLCVARAVQYQHRAKTAFHQRRMKCCFCPMSQLSGTCVMSGAHSNINGYTQTSHTCQREQCGVDASDRRQ